MVVVKIFGGLGNQMFQFIFGKYLEIKYKVEVKFDLNYFSYFNYRDPSILKLVHTINVLDDERIYFEYNPTKSFRINRIWNSIIHNKSYITERSVINDLSSLLCDNKIVYFDGYWQTNEYFSYFKCQVIHSFFNFSPNTSNLEFIKIHVRRGDYTTLPNSQIFCVQSVQYYIDALEYLFSSHGLDPTKVTVWVYSDDVDWVKNNFKFQYSLVRGSEIEDFLSLCSCKYLITSNSTYSLAAAYVNHENNIVVTPKLWYRDIVHNKKHTKKIYLPKWKVI